MARPLRIATIFELAPRKLGSLEDWIVHFAQAADRRGHHLTVFGSEPIHPEVHRELLAARARWVDLDALSTRPLRAIRWLARDFDVIHLNLFAPRDRIPCLAYAALPAKVIFVDHFSDHQVKIPAYRYLPRKLFNVLATIRVAHYIGVSNYVRDRARSRFGGRSFGETVYGGIDVERFTPGPPRPPDGVVRLLCVAHLIPEKGIDVLMQALASLETKGVTLTVVGDGPEEGRLRALAAKLGLEGRVSFVGLRDDVDALLRETDICVHPALWQEAFGLTVAEALACGRAVIASRVGAMPELIEHGVSGLLVPAGDSTALAAALGSLISQPELRAKLGLNARARATDRFRLETSVNHHLDRCESVVR